MAVDQPVMTKMSLVYRWDHASIKGCEWLSISQPEIILKNPKKHPKSRYLENFIIFLKTCHCQVIIVNLFATNLTKSS